MSSVAAEFDPGPSKALAQHLAKLPEHPPGRPRAISPEAEARAHELREKGMSIRHIAAALEAEGYLPAGGGAWQPSSLHRILNRRLAA